MFKNILLYYDAHKPLHDFPPAAVPRQLCVQRAWSQLPVSGTSPFTQNLTKLCPQKYDEAWTAFLLQVTILTCTS